MPASLDRAKLQRFKDAVEQCLRDGFTPIGQHGGKGSSTREATRRLRQAGHTVGRSAIDDFVRRQERRKARGVEHWLPDWSLYSEPGIASAEVRPGAVHRWLLTAAQDDTDVHPAFWSNLQAYATYLGAQIVVAGFTYQQVRHTDRLTLAETYRREIRDFLRFDPMDCGPVLFCAEMNTLPTAARPLSGLLTYSRGRDAVFPHAKLAYETVPQMPGSYVPSVMTTGAVTVPNYIPKKAGQKAEFHHVLGATLVEVDDQGAAWCRQIHAEQDGTFQDLDTLVRKGNVSRRHRVKAITWGDIHLPSVEEEVYRWLWGRQADSAIEALRPEYQFFHDLLSFEMWSRHVQDDPIHRARMVFRGQSGMAGHVAEGAAFLKDTQREWCRSVMVESNHDDRLRQWATHSCERTDVENVIYWHRMNIAMLEAERDEVEGFNVLRMALRQADPQGLPGIDFVPIGGSFVICQDHGGIECGMHGHLGPNGSRGSVHGLSRMASKITIGDKHAPAIHDGVFVAGMTGDLDQGYNKSPTSWRRAHVVAYPNGKRSIITQAADGRWRAA